MTKREQDIERLQRQRALWDSEIKTLQAQSEHADPKLREAYEQKVKLLEEKWRKIGERLATLRLEQAESWEEDTMLTGIFEIFDEIGRRVDELMSKLSR